MVYDAVFLTQHFVLYGPKPRKRMTSESNEELLVKLDRLTASISPYRSSTVTHKVLES